MNRAGHLFLLLLIMGLSFHVWGEPAGQDFNIDVLLQFISENSAGVVDYTEKRETPLRDEPVESYGQLEFIVPDTLIRRIESPVQAEFTISGQQVTILRDGRSKSRKLDQMPGLRGLAESLRATLAGDRERLETYYELQLKGSPEHWKLVLTPSDEGLEQVIESMEISGAGALISEVTLFDRKGGKTQTLFDRSGQQPGTG